MYVAVVRYGHDKIIRDKVAVLDTCDGAVELISYKDLKDYDIYVKNILSGRGICMVENTYLKPLLKGARETDFIHYKDSYLYVGDNRFDITIENRCVLVNGVVSLKGYIGYLSYPVLYRKYIVFRFYLNGIWKSVAVDEQGNIIATWSRGCTDSTNKGLSEQIDLFLEV